PYNPRTHHREKSDGSGSSKGPYFSGQNPGTIPIATPALGLSPLETQATAPPSAHPLVLEQPQAFLGASAPPTLNPTDPPAPPRLSSKRRAELQWRQSGSPASTSSRKSRTKSRKKDRAQVRKEKEDSDTQGKPA
ncbi:hypothetical protein KEM55_006092, partial [Ascosphaera atra]